MKNKIKGLFFCVAMLLGCQSASVQAPEQALPVFSGAPYEVINQNIPDFSDEELGTTAYKKFSSLDKLKRAGTAQAILGPELLPDKEREDISRIHPAGWVQHEYDFIDGGVLYNRSHLLAFSLTGENANPQNLITGTRYLNAVAMQPFENEILDYIRETGNHVLYRVTPVYEGDNLLADGVFMEAYSVEDQGQGISFHVYCFNVQPGVEIDYVTGENHAADQEAGEEEEQLFILNTRSLKFHDPDCADVALISAQNRESLYSTVQLMQESGYSPHKECIQGQ